MARANTTHGIGAVSFKHEAADAVAVGGLGDEGIALDRPAGSVSRLGSSSPFTATRISALGVERAQLRSQRVGRAFAGDVGLGDHQPVGQDRLLARFRRPAERVAAGFGIDHGHHHLDMEHLAERAVGGEGLQDRAWDRPARWSRSRRGGSRAVRRARARPPCGASACCRSVRVMQHRQPLPSSTVSSALERTSASSMPVAPNSLTTTAVPRPSGGRQKTLQQRGLAGAEKAGHHRHRHARAALALEPAPEEPGGRGGEELVHDAHITPRKRGGRADQKSISSVYSPPLKRSMV